MRIFSILPLFFAINPSNSNIPRSELPYTVFLHAVPGPLSTILTSLSAGAAYLRVYLLKIFVKPVLVATEVFVMATRFFSVALDFVGSFMRDGDQDPTWDETAGRYFISIHIIYITDLHPFWTPSVFYNTLSTINHHCEATISPDKSLLRHQHSH